MASAKKDEDWDNATHLLLGALKVTPPATHPPRPFHGGGPPPKLDARAYVDAALWLARFVAPWVEPKDKEAFDECLAIAKRRIALPKEAKPSKADAAALLTANAQKASRIPLKVGIWVVHETNNWATRPIYAGGAARPAAANVARFLLKQAPDKVPGYLAALDRACLNFEVLTVLRERDQMPSRPPVATVWRGHKDGKITHWLMRLPKDRYALLYKEKVRWGVVEGGRDDVLANVNEDQFEAAVNATVTTQSAFGSQ